MGEIEGVEPVEEGIEEELESIEEGTAEIEVIEGIEEVGETTDDTTFLVDSSKVGLAERKGGNSINKSIILGWDGWDCSCGFFEGAKLRSSKSIKLEKLFLGCSSELSSSWLSEEDFQEAVKDSSSESQSTNWFFKKAK